MPAVICAFVRSPFTPANKGELAKVRPDEMAGQVIKGLLGKVKITPEDIEDIFMGCAFPEGEQGFTMFPALNIDLATVDEGLEMLRRCI